MENTQNINKIINEATVARDDESTVTARLNRELFELLKPRPLLISSSFALFVLSLFSCLLHLNNSFLCHGRATNNGTDSISKSYSYVDTVPGNIYPS